MSSSVWLKQVEEGLMKEIRSCVKYINDEGESVEVNRVMVRKPEDDFLHLTGSDENIELPCVSISNYMTTHDKKRVTSESNTPVILSVKGSVAEVEDKAKPFKLYYQIDFWAEYADDISNMTMTWLAKHARWFNLEVVDSGGTKRDCYASINGNIMRSDQVVDNKRVFRAIINYCIRVEIDENNRYNTNIATDRVVSLAKQ